MNNKYDGDEPNVEGLVHEMLSRQPWDDPGACRVIAKKLAVETERTLAQRAARLKKEDDEAEEGQDD
jgi:hypothetical protein